MIKGEITRLFHANQTQHERVGCPTSQAVHDSCEEVTDHPRSSTFGCSEHNGIMGCAAGGRVCGPQPERILQQRHHPGRPRPPAGCRAAGQHCDPPPVRGPLTA